MNIEEVASSKARLRIASLLSIRPRTLGELAEITGMSVQGVLKHLGKLRESGFLTETELRNNKYLGYRKLYSAHGRRIGGVSDDGLMIAHISSATIEGEPSVERPYEQLEALAEDLIITRRRVRDLAKRLGRLIEDLARGQDRLERTIRAIGLDDEEEQIMSIFFTENSVEDAKRVLSRYYGSKDAERTIRGVLAKVKGERQMLEDG